MLILKKIFLSVICFIFGVVFCWGQSEKQLIKLEPKKSLSSQTNNVKVYEVDQDIDLSGEILKFPAGSQIVFNGGYIKNGIIEAETLLLNEWRFENVEIKGNVDFTNPVAVPIENPKDFITTILEYKPVNSILPTIFIFSSNQIYNWEGELRINKKNVTLTGGGTVEGHIHLGCDSDTFKRLHYDAYSATSHANIIISNLRFSKYQVIGSDDDYRRIEDYIESAELSRII